MVEAGFCLYKMYVLNKGSAQREETKKLFRARFHGRDVYVITTVILRCIVSEQSGRRGTERAFARRDGFDEWMGCVGNVSA